MIEKIKKNCSVLYSKLKKEYDSLVVSLEKEEKEDINKKTNDTSFIVVPDVITDENMKAWVHNEYNKKYKKDSFENKWKIYQSIKDFKINENIYETNSDIKYNENVQYIVKLAATYYFTAAFKAMKVDLTDPNVIRNKIDGNIGTPGRISKMYVGGSLSDDSELLSGRWTKLPRIAKFPNDSKQHFPITKRVDIVSVCSHHLAPFSSMFRPDAYAIISYIPEDYVLGISKLQRKTDHIARRGWLQEDLTREIYKQVSETAKTKNVYVRLYNLVHNCEFLRGAQSKDGCFTSEYYGGEFNKKELRDQVISK